MVPASVMSFIAFTSFFIETPYFLSETVFHTQCIYIPLVMIESYIGCVSEIRLILEHNISIFGNTVNQPKGNVIDFVFSLFIEEIIGVGIINKC